MKTLQLILVMVLMTLSPVRARQDLSGVEIVYDATAL